MSMDSKTAYAITVIDLRNIIDDSTNMTAWLRRYDFYRIWWTGDIIVGIVRQNNGWIGLPVKISFMEL